MKDNEENYSLVCVVNSVDEEKRTCDVSPVSGEADIFDVRLQAKVSGDLGIVVFPSLGSDVTVTFMSKDLAFVSSTSKIENIKINIGEFSLFVDDENFNKSVKNISIDTDSQEMKSNTSKFNVSQLFEVISANEIKQKALSYAIDSLAVDIKGITTITGNTTITGTTAISGAVTMAGAVSMGSGSNGGIPKGQSLAFELNRIVFELNKVISALKTWVPSQGDGGAALKALTSSFTNLDQVSVNNITNSNATH